VTRETNSNTIFKILVILQFKHQSKMKIKSNVCCIEKALYVKKSTLQMASEFSQKVWCASKLATYC